MKFDLKEYARRGAEARIAEVTAELEEIYVAFPDLRKNNRVAAAPIAEVSEPRRRRRLSMTPAQKRAVSVRMKKYWADRRKAVDAEVRAQKRHGLRLAKTG
jgi:hypothetical protein